MAACFCSEAKGTKEHIFDSPKATALALYTSSYHDDYTVTAGSECIMIKCQCTFCDDSKKKLARAPLLK